MQIKKLSKNYIFEKDGKTVCRFCTSWATTDEEVFALTDDIKRLKKTEHIRSCTE